MNRNNLKLAAATVGAGGLITMGALTAAFSGSTVAEPSEPGPITEPAATTGQTVTESPAASTPTTTIAVPEITGPAPLPSEEQGLPG